MTKEDFRRLDKHVGMRFRLIGNGKIGEACSFFKDSVLLNVKIERTLGAEMNTCFCPCEMVEPLEENTHGESIKR